MVVPTPGYSDRPGQVKCPERLLTEVQRRLRPAEIEKLVAAYHAGATIYELADQFRINRNTVSAILEREGIPRRNCPLSPEQVELAVKLYANGGSLETVGGRLGCSGSTVWHTFRKSGVKMRDSQGRGVLKPPIRGD